MRVSDNTAAGAVGDALKRTRTRMEELQIKNSIQKKIVTPSDDPAANSKIMDIRTQSATNSQFEQNAIMAKNRLSFTDAALNEMYDIFVRAKEIALSQSSDASASAESRTGVAQEVTSLYSQLVSVANRKVGNHYLFGGYKTQTPPYTLQGEYQGDMGQIPVEVRKGSYVAMNVPGPHVFEVKRFTQEDAIRSPAALEKTDPSALRNPEKAPLIEQGNPTELEAINAFHELDALRVGLLTNDTLTIRDTLERLDQIIENTITMRAKLHSRIAGVDVAVQSTQKTDLHNAELASKLEDADYAELWSNLAKEETVLRSSLHAAQKLIQPTLLDFLR